jgi:integrase/recombinase XerD
MARKATTHRRCWPVAEWPSLDQAAWTDAQKPGDPLEPGGIAAGWAITSRRQIEKAYGRWLGWLHTRSELDPLLPPAERATRERVAAYLAELRSTCSPFTVQSQLQQLGDALRAMAPEGKWRWIGRAAARLRAEAVSTRNKRSLLQSPAALVALGHRLMTEAGHLATTLEAAMTYRDGLVIALLALRPLRMRNLGMIRWGEHLIHRHGSWWLLFSGSETKNRQPLECPFPAELVTALERYLTVYRPILLTRGGRQAPGPIAALWVSRDGTALCGGTIAHHIKRHTRAEFGAAINPHLFRDGAATAIAVVDPEHVSTIATVLGHSTLATSERHYNQARGLEAGRRYHDTIETLRRRKGSAATPTSRGQGGPA